MRLVALFSFVAVFGTAWAQESYQEAVERLRCDHPSLWTRLFGAPCPATPAPRPAPSRELLSFEVQSIKCGRGDSRVSDAELRRCMSIARCEEMTSKSEYQMCMADVR